MNITEMVKIIRKQSGLTQREFGTKYNLHHSAIARYENGSRMPRADTFIAMVFDHQEKFPEIGMAQLLIRGNQCLF